MIDGVSIEEYELRACRDVPKEVFFPTSKDRHIYYQQIEVAKAICQECVIQDECLVYALKNDEKYGVWGGEDLGSSATRKAYKKISSYYKASVKSG